jgi:phage tail sheath gpL-like
MPDSISLNIPVDLRTPGQYIEIDESKAAGGLPIQQRRFLLLGHQTTAGTATVNVPIRVSSTEEAVTLFGRGSMLARMVGIVKRGPSANSDLWAMPVAEPSGGVAAIKTITLTVPGGGPTESGTLCAYVAGQRVEVAVRTGASVTATTLAAALVTELARYPDIPVTVTSNAGVVTLTSRHKGAVSSGIDIRHSYYDGERLPGGITFAVATSTPGSGDPSLTTALAALSGAQWYSIAVPWTADSVLTEVEEELTDRWGPLDMRTGHAFCALDDTFANLCTFGEARNSPHTTVWGMYSSPTWVPERAAALAGVCDYYGKIDPARPFQTLPVPGVMGPAENARFSRNERNLLLWDGISTCKHTAGGGTVIERIITSYRETTDGAPDPSLLDLNTVWTVDYIRFAVRSRIALSFPRHKLANDGVGSPGQAIATPRVIRAELQALFADLLNAGIIETMPTMQIVRSTDDVNRVNAIISPNVVNQFQVFAAAIQFRL